MIFVHSQESPINTISHAQAIEFLTSFRDKISPSYILFELHLQGYFDDKSPKDLEAIFKRLESYAISIHQDKAIAYFIQHAYQHYLSIPQELIDFALSDALSLNPCIINNATRLIKPYAEHPISRKNLAVITFRISQLSSEYARTLHSRSSESRSIDERFSEKITAEIEKISSGELYYDAIVLLYIQIAKSLLDGIINAKERAPISSKHRNNLYIFVEELKKLGVIKLSYRFNLSESCKTVLPSVDNIQRCDRLYLYLENQEKLYLPDRRADMFKQTDVILEKVKSRLNDVEKILSSNTIVQLFNSNALFNEESRMFVLDSLKELQKLLIDIFHDNSSGIILLKDSYSEVRNRQMKLLIEVNKKISLTAQFTLPPASLLSTRNSAPSTLSSSTSVPQKTTSAPTSKAVRSTSSTSMRIPRDSPMISRSTSPDPIIEEEPEMTELNNNFTKGMTLCK